MPADQQSQQHKQRSADTLPASGQAISSTLTALANMRLLNLSTVEEFQFWESALADMTEVELRRGVRKALDFDGKFFHLPAFRKLCRIDSRDIGAPDSREAYRIFCSDGWRLADHTGLIADAVNMADEYRLSRMSAAEGYRTFKECYETAIKNCMREANDRHLLLPSERRDPQSVGLIQ